MRLHTIFALALVALLGCAPVAPAPAPLVASAPQALTGSVQVANGSAPCPSSAPAGALCATVSVACGGLPALGATLVVSNPPGVSGLAGRAQRLVIYYSGGAGTGLAAPYQAIVPSILALPTSTKIAQVVWQQVGAPGGWEATPQLSIRTGSCRPALLTQWLDAQIGGTVATCGQGYSAGSAALAYALAYHGAGAWLDAVQLLSGPPMARLDLGCAAPPYATATSSCGVTYALGLEPPHTSWIDGWLGTTECASAPSDPAKLVAEGILTGSGPPVLAYAHTWVGLVDDDDQTAAAGGSVVYEQALVGAGTHTTRACVTDGVGENVFAGPAGRAAVVAQLDAICGVH